ncbi:MAG: ATP-binding protein, partial [Treponema sp.]|nr:ATP-binding protein [Treponema sp.]
MNTIVLDADLAKLEDLRGFIGAELDRAECPNQERRRIELAAEELFVNIAFYAYRNPLAGGETGEPARLGSVTVRCGTQGTSAGTTLTLSFTDRGEPFNPLEHPEPDLAQPLEARPAGGLGILMVKRMMDAVVYDRIDGTNHLTLQKSWET